MSEVGDDMRPPVSSLAVVTSESAHQKQKIAQLEEKLQLLESGQAAKQREINYYMLKGRAVRWIVTLYDNIKDLIGENDRRCNGDDDGDDNVTPESVFYICLMGATHSFVNTGRIFCKSDMEYDDYIHMLKKLRQGADSARGDDTSKLKNLVPKWVNQELKPDPPVDHEDKHYRKFVNDACGRLLCPTKMDWNNPSVRAGIRDRTDGHIMTEMSWPAFLYQGYTADANNLEQGLFKSKLLIQAFKAIFTSPSSAKEVAGDGDGANIIENNRHANKDISGKKVKTHVAQIINMQKVTPRSITYVSCQLQFALSSVTSWRSIDSDFDYIQFWCNMVDFFEKAPGRAVQHSVDRLLIWWTRKVFGTSHHAEVSDEAKARMLVNALAVQRVQLDDALFDSE